MIEAYDKEAGTVTHTGCGCCGCTDKVLPGDQKTSDEYTLGELVDQLNEDAATTAGCAEAFGLVRNPDTMLWEAPK